MIEKILFAASEARHFAASGGLADVVESLPRSLVRKGLDCRVIIPLYGRTSEEIRQSLVPVAQFGVPVGWRRKDCRVYSADYGGVTFYLVENDEYFGEGPMYGHANDHERFAFFSRAVLEALPHIGFRPDVIQANDWQTALVPIYQHVLYSRIAWYSGIKTVFTIHNIAFQGWFGYDVLDEYLGLPGEAVSLLEYDGCLNLMKGAIVTAHSVVTVSPKYSQEISGNHYDTSGYDFGHGLTPLIHDYSRKLTGILNGIDDEDVNPASDGDLYANYDLTSFPSGKKTNKKRLQARLGLLPRNVPLIGAVTRIDSQQKGCQLVIEAIRMGLLDHNDVQFVLLGNASDSDKEGKKMENVFRALEYQYKGRFVAYIGYLPELASKIYAAADILTVPSKYEPCGLTQLYALRYGSIPVVRETGGLADTVTDNEHGQGNGFRFQSYRGGDLKFTIERALGSYRNRKGWNALTRRAMKCDYSWDACSADDYVKLYGGL